MANIILRYLGHASFEVIVDGSVIYIDPYAGEYRDKADLILMTHSHRDHCDPDKIEKIKKLGTLLVGPENCRSVISGNFKSITVGDSFDFHGIMIEAVPAYNFKRFRFSGVPFHPKDFGVGYLLHIGELVIYHAGDTDFISEMKNLKNIYLFLLPVGGTYTMDVEEAVEATLVVKPVMAIPMHIRDADPEEFKKLVESKSNVKVSVLSPGEEIRL